MLTAMKMDRTRWMVLCCGLMGVWLPGCLVRPGEIDEGLMARYHRSVLDRSPQPRAGRAGLGLLRPVPGKARPLLRTVKDPLTGERAVELSLEQAVRMAMAGSPEIRVVSFDPAILREDMVAAAAAFDVIVFGGLTQRWTDRNQGSTVLGGQVHTTEAEAGLRKKNIYGGQAELAWNLTRTSDDSTFVAFSPRFESTMTLELTQPLLRTAGKDYNLAALRLAELGHRIGYAQFRQKVEEIVAQVEQTYWGLVQARGSLEIQQQILRDGEATLKKVEARVELDARVNIEVQQARVAVYQRRAGLIQTRKVVANAEDVLARLLSDPRLNLPGDYRIKPTDVEEEVAEFVVDPLDQLANALRYSPLLEQARLAIDAARINVRVARNETLPALSFIGSVGIQGLDGNPSQAVEEMRLLDYIDYSMGLLVEYPWGNRAAEARLRQRRFEQRKSVAALQRVADQVAGAVNETVREVQSSYEEIAAQEEIVRALEKNLAGLEALLEFGRQSYLSLLQLTLQQQDALGLARRARLQAVVNFRNAQARLAQLTGTALQQHHIKLMAEEISGYRRPGRTPPAAPVIGPVTGPASPATLPGR